MTAVTFTPAYTDWYRATTGNAPRHVDWNGWHITHLWNGRSKTAQTLRTLLDDAREGELYAALEFRPPLVLQSSAVLYGTRIHVPLRFVERVGQGGKLVQLELWSEGRAA